MTQQQPKVRHLSICCTLQELLNIRRNAAAEKKSVSEYTRDQLPKDFFELKQRSIGAVDSAGPPTGKSG